jgi:hypothetical protein
MTKPTTAATDAAHDPMDFRNIAKKDILDCNTGSTDATNATDLID